MGPALYVLLLNAPLWLPSFLAWYWVVRDGPRPRRIALVLWVPAVLILLVGPWAADQDLGTTLLIVLVGCGLGALMGWWQRRIAPR
ncbi:hypothetical protein [Muricoccus radiodurans]|uniref:hypothetical protein n=1 Tax=Muricoccus radiodurans TaxID=2231721 RepID=UPI003CE827BE